MTPLVDVCLVLLIIFMVVTPMLVEGVGVKLPETTDPDRLPEIESQLEVAITSSGQVFVGAQPVPSDGLPALLRDLYEGLPDRRVVIRADQRLAYSDVREVMRLVHRAGWTGAGVETRKREEVCRSPSPLPGSRCS